MPTLSDLGELALIARLAAARGGEGVIVGSGDDAAVLRPRAGRDLVVTTDAFVEGRHWDPAWIDPVALGARLAAANLSDLAAMAAAPRWATVALGARPEADADAIEATHGALARALAAEGAVVVGGNVTAVTGETWWCVTLVGEVAAGAAWTRAGARAGDRLVVTGHPGRAGAGLRLARRLGEGADAPRWAALLDAWRAPVGRVALAAALAPLGVVRAAIDLSDGLAGDLAHLCAASGVGAVVEERALPPDGALLEAAEALGVAPETLRFGPSDDYELLLAVAPEGVAACQAAAAGLGASLTAIGRFEGAAHERHVEDPAGAVRPLEAAGFDHFGS